MKGYGGTKGRVKPKPNRVEMSGIRFEHSGIKGFVLCLAAATLAVLAGCGKRGSLTESFEDAFDKGWGAYRLSEFDRAQRFFEDALTQAEASDSLEARVKANYSLGDLWNLRRPNQDPRKAEGFYKKVVELDPRSEWAAWASLALARQMQLEAVTELPDLVKLKARYDDVINRYPNHQVADESVIYLQSARLVRASDESITDATRDLEAFVRERTNSLYLANAYSLLANAYHHQGRGRDYIETLVKSVELSRALTQNANLPASDQAATFYKIGLAAQLDAGDFALAREYFNLLIMEYPRDQRVFVAEQQLAAMNAYEARVREELRKQKDGE